MKTTVPYRINIHRLAGRPGVVEIDLGGAPIRVTELDGPSAVYRTGGEVRRELWSARIEETPDNSPGEIGSRIRDILQGNDSRASRACVFLRPQALRIVRAEPPEGETRIKEWIEDHADTLLNLPVSARDIAMDYRQLSDDRTEGSIEVAFAKRQEIDRCVEICRSAGLEPASVTIKPDPDSSHNQPFEFLPSEVRDADETRTYQSLTRRAGLLFGSLLLLFLAFDFAASWYLDTQAESLDESSHSTEYMVREVAALEEAVRDLGTKLATVRQGSNRTQRARTLHELARTVPRGVRLRKIDITEENTGRSLLQVEGEVASHAHLASYLAALDTAAFCAGMRLGDTDPQGNSFGGERRPQMGVIQFEIRGELH